MVYIDELLNNLKKLPTPAEYNFNGTTTTSESFLLGNIGSYDYFHGNDLHYNPEYGTDVAIQQIKYLSIDDVFDYHDSIQGKKSAFDHLDKREMTQVVLEAYELNPTSVNTESNIIKSLIGGFDTIIELTENEKLRLIFNALLLHDTKTDTKVGNGTDPIYAGWRSNTDIWKQKLSKISQADIDIFAVRYGLDDTEKRGLNDLVTIYKDPL